MALHHELWVTSPCRGERGSVAGARPLCHPASGPEGKRQTKGPVYLVRLVVMGLVVLFAVVSDGGLHGGFCACTRVWHVRPPLPAARDSGCTGERSHFLHLEYGVIPAATTRQTSGRSPVQHQLRRP